MAHPQSLRSHGDFTILKYIEHLDGPTLERHLGFSSGRLKPGFQLVMLAPDEVIGPDDFSLEASTRYSGGMISKGPGDSKVGIEALLRNRQQDPAALRAKVAGFFLLDRAYTPARIITNLKHAPGMIYPAGQALPDRPAGVPQFHLKAACAKKFVVLREDPGY